MKATHCTLQELNQALEAVNEKYGDNVIWNREPSSGSLHFTLRVKDSHGKGARLGFPSCDTGNQRHLVNACWHVHGEFFDALFAINPDAIIRSNGQKITAEYGNWQDRDIGSLMQPLYFSEACEC